MKRVLLLLFPLLITKAFATTWNVSVANFQFTPSTLNVTVGDVIHFVWVSGSHTTTSTSVPAGAATWNSNMNSVTTSFNYTVTVAGTYNYWCEIHAPGMAGSFNASPAVPVTLSSFDIVALNGKPHLKWTTATELNADYFSIRKSVNGTTFQEIARVPATGNSNTQRIYTYNDPNLATSQYVYYSLGMVDKDGTMQLSPIKMYRNNTAAKKIITSISPNPVVGPGHLMIKFNADKVGVLIAKVFDNQGRLILSSELSAETGINNGHIHLGNIPAGNYTSGLALTA